MQSFITIDKLQVYANHGVTSEELKTGNLFEVSVTVEFDFVAAAKADSVALSINYAELTALVLAVMRRPRNLIETVAYEMYTRIISQWPSIKSGTISITKVHPPIQYPAPQATATITW